MNEYHKKYEEYRRKMILQKLMGFGLLAMSGFLFFVISQGATPEDRDCTPLLITVPMALYLIFGKRVIIM